MAPTSMVNFSHSGVIPAKNTGDKDANNNTMAMFIRLLATKMVARSFLGLANNFFTRANFLGRGFPSSVFKSVVEREKNATSAPEIRAEKNNKIARITKLVI